MSARVFALLPSVLFCIYFLIKRKKYAMAKLRPPGGISSYPDTHQALI